MNGDASDMHVWSGAADMSGGVTMKNALGIDGSGLVVTGGLQWTEVL